MFLITLPLQASGRLTDIARLTLRTLNQVDSIVLEHLGNRGPIKTHFSECAISPIENEISILVKPRGGYYRRFWICIIIQNPASVISLGWDLNWLLTLEALFTGDFFKIFGNFLSRGSFFLFVIGEGFQKGMGKFFKILAEYKRLNKV